MVVVVRDVPAAIEADSIRRLSSAHDVLYRLARLAWTRPTRSARSQPERVSGKVEMTMSSGA